MSHPTGKTLIQGADGQLYIVAREVDHDGEVAYVLHAARPLMLHAYRHKHEAVRAVCDQTVADGGAP